MTKPSKSPRQFTEIGCQVFVTFFMLFFSFFFLTAFLSQYLPLMLALAGVIWLAWLSSIARVTRLASSHRDRLALYLMPIGCQIVLTACLFLMFKGWARPGVTHWYGASSVFVALAAGLFPLWGWGLSPRQDVAERRNRYAGWVIAGATLGLALECAGLAEGVALANTQNGELPAPFPPILGLFILLAFFAFFILWGILEKTSNFTEAITVERDGGAALRLGAFLLALGMVIGSILAYTFPLLAGGKPPPLALRERDQLRSLALGPVVLLVAAVVIERMRKAIARGSSHGPSVIDGVIAIVYVGGAILWAVFVR